MYGLEPTALASYEFKKVTILTAGVEPKDAALVLPEECGDFIADPRGRVLRSVEELETVGASDEVIRPYWNPQNDVG